MRTTTANYDAENAKRGKTPVVIAEFSGITKKFASGDFKNISANHKKVISRMRTNLMSIDILEGKTDFGNTEFDCGDKDLEVSNLLKDNVDLPNRNVTVKIGYEPLDDTDFVSLPAVQLKDPQLTGPLTWNFRTKDIISKLDKKIFTGGPTAIVQADYSSGNLQVDDTSDFYASFPSWMKTYIVVGGEIMAYTGTGSGPTSFTGISRAQLGSKSGNHNAGDEVKQIVGFEDVNPMHALLTVLLSGDPNDTTVKHGYYDVLTALGSGNSLRFGMGLTDADVDVEQIEEFGWKHFEDAEYCLYLAGKDEVNGWDWLVDNIFKPTGTFPYIGSNGKIRVGFIDWIELNENYVADDTILSADIDEKTSTPKYKIDWKNFHNVVEFRYGRNSAIGGHQNIKRYKLDNSVTSYFQTAPFVITTPNLLRAANADWIKAVLAKRWLYFLANPHAVYECHVSSQKWLLEAADEVDLTYDKFPDLIAGTRGWSAKKSFIQGTEVDWYPEPAKFFVEGRTWELFNKVANFYTITKVTTGGGNLGLNADNSATFNIGSDQRIDLPGVTSAQIYIAFVDMTPPGTATTTHETVSLGMHLQSAFETDLYTDNRPFIRYQPSDSTLRTLAFITTANSAFNPDNVKMDWYAASAASADRPTLNFQAVWAIILDQNMTEI